ncbi:MAG: hypothetical protein JWL69_4427 [Phycisphaerales bacterium]|nr:hypothetical protein [Phycisphaerales bacterium]
MNRRKILSRLACSVAAVVVLAAQSRAGALKPSDLVVSWAGYPSSFVQEYTPSGTLVQSWTITSHFSGENARDVGVDNSGDIVIYNGTFSPSLTILNPVTGGKTNYSFSGWNTVADVRWGTLAVLGKFAYATDDEIGTDAGGQNGIVRFNLANGSAQRFFSRIDTTSI